MFGMVFAEWTTIMISNLLLGIILKKKIQEFVYFSNNEN